MDKAPVALHPVKGRAAEGDGKVARAAVAAAEKVDAATQAAVRAAAAEVEAGVQVPARRHPLQPDSLSASTGKEVRDMPGFDESGPNFAGPMTGGARGYCTQDVPPHGPGFNRGPGVGRGRGCWQRQGRGFRQRMGFGRFAGRSTPVFDPLIDTESMINQLDQQAQSMQRNLDALNARIESLKTDASQDA